MANPPGVSIAFFTAVVGLFAAATYSHNRPAREKASPAKAAPASLLSREDRVRAMLETAPRSPAYDFAFNALDPAFEISQSATSQFDPVDDYWGLPRDEGYEEVSAYCGACHSLAIVMQQSATPTRWSELLDWMVEKQGMAPLRAEDETRVHAYLSEHFGSE